MSRNPVLGLNTPNLTAPTSALSDGAAPAGSVRLALVFPAAGGVQAIDALGNVTTLAGSTSGAALLAANNTFTGRNTFAPAVATSGTATAITLTGAANTGQTAGTEVPDLSVNLNRTVQFATGAKTLQRAVLVTAPTYTAVAATLISDAATLAINDAPTLSTNITATRNHALWVQSGLARFDGGIGATGANSGAVTCLTVQRAVNLGAAGAANIATRVALAGVNDASASVGVGFLTATLATATSGGEIGNLSLGGTSQGIGVEAVRLMGVAGTIENRLQITPAADSGVVSVAATGGPTAGSLALSCNGGTGFTSLRGSVATNIVAVDNGGGASAPRLGFFNVTPLIRQTVANCTVAVDGTSAGTQLNDLLAKLRLFGLLT